MKEFISPLKGEAVTIVKRSNCAAVVRSGSLEVFATPMMIALMEEASCNACMPLLDDGETTVGIKISVSHDKASGVGAVITAYASLEKTDGRRLIFSVSAVDDNDNVIGKGEIERFVVIGDKFMRKVHDQ